MQLASSPFVLIIFLNLISGFILFSFLFSILIFPLVYVLFKKFCVKIFSNKFFFPCVDTICVVRPYLMFSDVLHKSYFPTNAFTFASAFFCQKWDFPHINTIFLKYDIVKEIVHDYTIKNQDWYVRCYFERI